VVSLGAGKGSVVRGPDGKRRFLPPPPLEPLAPSAQDAKAALVEDVQAVLRLGPQSYHHHASGLAHNGESDTSDSRGRIPYGHNDSIMSSNQGGLLENSAELAAGSVGRAPGEPSGLGWGPQGDAPTPRGQGHVAAAPMPTQVEATGTGAVVLPAIPAAAATHSASSSAAAAAAAAVNGSASGHSQFPWRQSRQQTAAVAAAAAHAVAVAVARANGPGAHPLVRLHGNNNNLNSNTFNYSGDPRATPPRAQQQQHLRTIMPGQLLQPSLGSSSLNASSVGAAALGASLPRGPSAHVALPHQLAATGGGSSSVGGTLRLPSSGGSGGRAGMPLAAQLSAAPGLSAASSAYSSRQR